MNTSQRRPRPRTLARSVLAIGLLVAAALVATPAAPASAEPLANHVVGWGYNGFCCPYQYVGQATPPPGLTDVVAISARGYRSLALRGDGTVVGWGLNENGQGTPPAGLTGVVAIAVGSFHSLALRGDGTVVGWGHNSQGQATPPAGLTDAVAIAAGYNHSLALRSNGTVVGWGFNGDGRATPPSGLTGVAAIAAGERHSLAVVQGHDSLALDVWAGPATKRTLVYSQGLATLISGDYVIRPATETSPRSPAPARSQGWTDPG